MVMGKSNFFFPFTKSLIILPVNKPSFSNDKSACARKFICKITSSLIKTFIKNSNENFGGQLKNLLCKFGAMFSIHKKNESGFDKIILKNDFTNNYAAIIP